MNMQFLATMVLNEKVMTFLLTYTIVFMAVVVLTSKISSIVAFVSAIIVPWLFWNGTSEEFARYNLSCKLDGQVFFVFNCILTIIGVFYSASCYRIEQVDKRLDAAGIERPETIWEKIGRALSCDEDAVDSATGWADKLSDSQTEVSEEQ